MAKHLYLLLKFGITGVLGNYCGKPRGKYAARLGLDDFFKRRRAAGFLPNFGHLKAKIAESVYDRNTPLLLTTD